MSQSFKQLQKIWYKKLKDSGFEDIEKENGELKDFHSFKFQRTHSPVSFELNARYYELASQLTHEYPFKSRRDKQVWVRHANGETLEQIAKEMGLSHNQTWRIVDKISSCIKVNLK